LNHRVCPYRLYQSIKDGIMKKVDDGKVSAINMPFLVKLECDVDLQIHVEHYAHTNQDIMEKTGPDLHYERLMQEEIDEKAAFLERPPRIVKVKIRDPVDAIVSIGGMTRLHVVANEGDLDEVKRLVGDGASTRIKDTFGFTPYERAMLKGHNNVAEYLK